MLMILPYYHTAIIFTYYTWARYHHISMELNIISQAVASIVSTCVAECTAWNDLASEGKTARDYDQMAQTVYDNIMEGNSNVAQKLKQDLYDLYSKLKARMYEEFSDHIRMEKLMDEELRCSQEGLGAVQPTAQSSIAPIKKPPTPSLSSEHLLSSLTKLMDVNTSTAETHDIPASLRDNELFRLVNRSLDKKYEGMAPRRSYGAESAEGHTYSSMNTMPTDLHEKLLRDMLADDSTDCDYTFSKGI
jgi:hypothetical protein